MKHIQRRIGIIFGVFSFVLFIVKFIYNTLNDVSLSDFATFDNLSYFIYAFIFTVTSMKRNLFGRILQVAILFVESIFALFPDSTSPFFGMVLIVVAILLCYVYKFFVKHNMIKIMLFSIVFYFIFAFIPLENNSKKFLLAFEWELFIGTFLFLLWIIFKDSIEELKDEDKITNLKLIRLLEESRDATTEAMRLGREALDELKKVNGGSK